MSDTKTLAQRILGVMKQMGAVGKTGQSTQGGRYEFHKIDDVEDELRKALIENEIIAIPVEVTEQELVCTTDKNGKSVWQASCKITIHLINADGTEEPPVQVQGWGQGNDYSDKATGKAYSYALKAAYLSAFHLRGQPDTEPENIEAEKAVDEFDKAAIENITRQIKEAGTLETLKTIGNELQECSGDIKDAVRRTYQEKKRELEGGVK
jgi:hypothetical protein